MLNKFHKSKSLAIFCFVILYKFNFYIMHIMIKKLDLTKIEYNQIIALLLAIIFAIIYLYICTRKKCLKDFKTGARNGECLKLNVEKNIMLKKTFSIFYIDLDKFKNVNDQYGHEVGDEFLKIFVKRVTKVLPKNVIFYRIGGDEFVAIAKNIKTLEQKKQIIKCINQVKSSNVIVEKEKIDIAFSIGVATFPTDAKSFLRLKENADKCMYIAKKNTKCNFVIYGENIE